MKPPPEPADQVIAPEPAWTQPFCMRCGRHHAPRAPRRSKAWWMLRR